METDRLIDYFIVSGVPYLNDSSSSNAENVTVNFVDPIVEIAVINRTLEETLPSGFECVEVTPSGLPANLNHGSILADDMYLCFRRSRNEIPITSIGIYYEGREKIRKGFHVISSTVGESLANINNANSPRIFLTAEYANEMTAIDALVVTDICVILANKNESPPPTFFKIPKAINTALVGSNVFVCYKKTSVKLNSLVYKPIVHSRYPLTDYNDFILPDIATFCLPLGAELIASSSKAAVPDPQFFSFVLTSEKGNNAYGGVLMFYEKANMALLTSSQKSLLLVQNHEASERIVYATKSICVISQWPFFDAFHTFLKHLHKLCSGLPQSLPIERHIAHFMSQVPLPTASRPQVHVQLASEEELLLYLPQETALPLSGASFTNLLKQLTVDNVILLMIHVLLEHKIVIHSLRSTYLTGIAEAARMLVFPFHWQMAYVPLCPLSLSDVLSAPQPFIVGIDSRYFDSCEVPSDAVFIDLDTNTISGNEEFNTFGNKFLPKKATKLLRTSLEALQEKIEVEESYATKSTSKTSNDMSLSLEVDIAKHKKRRVMELAVQETFLQFIATCMQGYSNYLRPITGARSFPTTDLESLFDDEGFLKSRERSQHKFYQLLMKTQMFERFIGERSFASDKDTGLAFFDDYIDKLSEKGGSLKLGDSETKRTSSKTVFIMPPDISETEVGITYSYDRFPELQPELFCSGIKSNSLPVVKQPPTITSPHIKKKKVPTATLR